MVVGLLRKSDKVIGPEFSGNKNEMSLGSPSLSSHVYNLH